MNLKHGQIWKNCSKVAQISKKDEMFRAAIMEIGDLKFIDLIENISYEKLADDGYVPTDMVLIAQNA